MTPRPSKTVNYEVFIGVGSRIRVQLIIDEGRTRRFAVSLEYLCLPDDWRRVVCIDNWGGTVHRDRYHPDGSDLAHHEPVFDSNDTDLSAQWAFDHLEDQADRYVHEFKALPGSDCT